MIGARAVQWEQLLPCHEHAQRTGRSTDKSRTNRKALNLRFRAFRCPTGDECGSKGIRTPDPLHAMQVRYRAAPWTHSSVLLFRKGNLNRVLQTRAGSDTLVQILHRFCRVDYPGLSGAQHRPLLWITPVTSTGVAKSLYFPGQFVVHASRSCVNCASAGQASRASESTHNLSELFSAAADTAKPPGVTDPIRTTAGGDIHRQHEGPCARRCVQLNRRTSLCTDGP
ncbi:MAG: hypothetical protein JWQ43_1292 [Glaciihabitans sp.]|nr:hypothetical protein [Glaciihabitans sp.]